MSRKANPKISIITKAYNAEKYIVECAESVCGQTFEDFEWLVLENGSTDDTGKILEEYAKRDKRIRLFVNRENYNQRQPKAGFYTYHDMLNMTQGEYIADLDSDDFLDINFLKILYEQASECGADIIAAGSVQFKEENPMERRIVVPKEFHEADIRLMGEHIIDFYDAFRPTWGKLVSRKFYIAHMNYLHDTKIQIINGSDTLTCLRMLQKAESCVCVERPLYYYRIRRNSVMNSHYSRKRQQGYDMLFYEGRRLLEKWQKNTPENFYYLCLIHLSSLEINFNMLVNAADISLKERLDFMEQLLQNPVYLEYIEMFPEERKKAFEAKINLTLEKLGQAFGQNILLFYQYHFGRIYLGQKWIMENRSGFYEIALYVVSFLSKHHILAYESELLNLGVSFLTGESCVSLEQARYIMEQYIKSEGNLLEEKELLWRSSQQNNTERALLYLTIADELYPDNQEIKEKINRCFV